MADRRLDPPPHGSVLEMEVRASKTMGEMAREVRVESDERPKRRMCTDVLCLTTFIAYVTGLVMIFIEAHTKGNIARVTHGFDWEGRICSVDAGVENQPYLYWCVSQGGVTGLKLLDGICVKECPSSSETKHLCPGLPQITRTNHTMEGGKMVAEVTLKREISEQPDFPTTPLLGMYCLPSSKQLMGQMLDRPVLGDFNEKLFTSVNFVYAKKWFFLALTAGVFAGGYAYVFLLKIFVRPCMHILIALTNLAFMGGILYLLAVGLPTDMWGTVGLDPSWGDLGNPFIYVAPAGKQKMWALASSAVVLAIWFLLFIFWCCAKSAMKLTCDAIQQSCNAVTAMPTLLLQPIVQTVSLIVVFCFMIYGFGIILSLGHVETKNPLDMSSNIEVTGILRSFAFTERQQLYMVYWCFGALWLLELVRALGQFAVSHAIVMSQLSGNTTWLPLSRGYLKGIFFHLGSLAFGAFILGLLGFFTWFLRYMAKQTKDAGGQRSAVLSVVFACASCCLQCVEALLRVVNQMVYVDIVIQGTNYMTSSWHVWKMYAKNPVTVSTAISGTRLVKWLGLFVIGGAGTFATMKSLSNPGMLMQWFNQQTAEPSVREFLMDDASELYGASVVGGTIVGAAISFAIAASFMEVVDMSCESLTYCLLWKGDGGRDRPLMGS